ncbi:MAG: hypothetical protein SGI91_02035 [Alphaproteobacteria bacterium]|jgi:hypothetical protein|nr:hypothetical protein [Alphaproteobacteria bacterium]
MNIQRFKTLVEAYGANPARWPEAERVAALLFAEQSAEARDMLQEAAAFDRLLDTAETHPATRTLEDRILATFPERTAKQRAPWFTMRWIPAAAVACSLALGLAVGAALPGLAGVNDTAVDPALIALSGGDADWADMGDGI